MRRLVDLDGCVLECDLRAAPNAPGSGLLAVILHPWGRLGGCMDDPTVVAQFNAALGSGVFDGAVRYNQRCAGRSRGKAQPSANPDADDLTALCHCLLAEPLPGAAAPAEGLALVCYSYGSCVGAAALARVPEVVAYVSIAFPLGVLSRWFLGSGASWAALAASPVPKLMIMGDADNFTSRSQLRAAVAEHDAAPGAGPLDVRVLAGGVDHFFAGRWDEVASQAMQWLAGHLGDAVAAAGVSAAG